MAVRKRLHVPGGTYYVVQRGSSQPMFSRIEDYALFERLLADTLRCTGTRVHAYCWTPEDIHLALQIDEVPLSRVFQRVASRYARAVQERCGKTGHFFQQRYHSILIDPDAYLLRLMRYIHYIPGPVGCAMTAESHPRSSHAAYLGLATVPWLTTQIMMRRLSRGAGEDVLHAYVEFMARAPSAEDAFLFEHGSPSEPRVLADADFLATLPRTAGTYRSRTSLDQLINSVAIALGIEREHILSSSRQRELALARAVITWHATERRIASLAEIARRFRRDPSTLSSAVQRYRRLRPELFKLSALPDFVPMGWGLRLDSPK